MHDDRHHKKSDTDTTPLREQAEVWLKAKEERGEIDDAQPSQYKVYETLRDLKVHQIELEMQNEALRQSELRTQEAKDRYFDLYDLAPIGYCTLDKKGLILESNLTVSTLLGMSRQSLFKRPITGLVFEEDQDVYYLFRKRYLESEEKESCELRMLDDKGGLLWVELTATVQHVSKQFSLIMLVINDISERKRLEAQVKEQEQIMLAQSRNAAMGEMTSMIAHQWRQPLTVIAMGANNILADIELGDIDEDGLRAHALRIIDQTNHLSHTIDDFRDFFRPDKGLVTVRLQDVISDAQKLIGKSLEDNAITLSVQVKSDHKITTYSRELLQVYLNLLTNAKEALVENKTKAPRIDVEIDEKEGQVITTICDNDGGIDDRIIDKVFDPYFSTKSTLQGTGLGLYMSKTIVERHLHGMITVTNSDEGVCFKVSLPIEPEA